jgi:hypothetical protein
MAGIHRNYLYNRCKNENQKFAKLDLIDSKNIRFLNLLEFEIPLKFKSLLRNLIAVDFTIRHPLEQKNSMVLGFC